MKMENAHYVGGVRIKMGHELEMEFEVYDYKKQNLKKLFEANQGKFFTASRLTYLCELQRSATSVELRKIVKELVADGVPIVSTSVGFAHIDIHSPNGQNMIRKNIEHFEQRIKGIERSTQDLRGLLSQ